jgi:hypothetical protein
VGADETLLQRAREIMKQSPRNNLTVIVVNEAELRKHAPLRQFFEAGCAVIEGEVVQLEAKDRVLMLADERIICFEKCYLL